MKRKRIHVAADSGPKPKRTKPSKSGDGITQLKSRSVYQPLLNHVYAEVRPLKDYLINVLPATSRVRRRLVQSVEQRETDLHDFLSTILVCTSTEQSSNLKIGWQKDLEHFTQTQRSGQGQTAPTRTQNLSEVVDFVIWYLFHKHSTPNSKPNNVLCHGFERSVTTTVKDHTNRQSHHPRAKCYDNTCVETLRSSCWSDLMKILGRHAHEIMVTILINHSVFTSVANETGSYSQLSGIPIKDLMDCGKPFVPRRNDIVLVRSRILYGKPSFNKAGQVRFGLRRSHILQRLDEPDPKRQCSTLMRYIFPKQFGLPNVFTATVNRKKTGYTFKNYMRREDDPSWTIQKNIPRRLRGHAIQQLIHNLIRGHSRCSFHQLISHYCPIPVPKGQEPFPKTKHLVQCSRDSCQKDARIRTQLQPDPTITTSEGAVEKQNEEECVSLLPYITDSIQVAAFCKAVLQRVLPSDLLGHGSEGERNWNILLENVAKFVCMRKTESTNLHQLVQHLKLRSIQWLVPSSIANNAKMASSDKAKREELLCELIYFIFDSLLIPIINSNFYVTQSGIHRNKLLFFRHDVWYRLCQPSLRSIKLNSLVPVKARNIGNVTSKQTLGYSNLRVLPKDSGVRSIINLGHRPCSMKKGEPSLQQSINKKMSPVFSIFNLERHSDTTTFRADSMTVGDLHTKLQSFKSRLSLYPDQDFYFVKVDIRSAFDSIPQARLLDIVQHIFKHSQYNVTTHCEGKKLYAPQGRSKTSTRYPETAAPNGLKANLVGSGERQLSRRKNIVYTSLDRSQVITRDEAKELLEEHVQNSIIRIDKRYYRQSVGIAQGSILSSLLCTFFYNDFQRQRLGFLNPTSSALLRMIDDFLLITTKREEAVQFVSAMLEGDTSYGIRVNPEKSLANFEMMVNGAQLSRLTGKTAFPFCGLLIDTKTLQVSQNRVRKDNDIINTLKVDLHGKTGHKFRWRMEHAMRIQLKEIMLDAVLNDRIRIVRTLIESFQETAMKMHQYYRCLPRPKQPSQKVLIQLIQHLINLVLGLLHQSRNEDSVMFGRPQISCIAAVSMSRVLLPKRSHYPVLMVWLRSVGKKFEHSLNLRESTLEALSEAAFESLRHYKY